MESRSIVNRILSAVAMTFALLGAFARWDRIGLVEPFGNPNLTPLLFAPLAFVSAHCLLRSFDVSITAPNLAIRAAAVGALVLCLLVAVLPLSESGTLIVSGIVAAFFVSLQVLRASYPR